MAPPSHNGSGTGPAWSRKEEKGCEAPFLIVNRKWRASEILEINGLSKVPMRPHELLVI